MTDYIFKLMELANPWLEEDISCMTADCFSVAEEMLCVWAAERT
ncbi:hypothetical protein [Pelosinus baikalensis]|nr:hypothetical protein [Pelosinus baikalensis]